MNMDARIISFDASGWKDRLALLEELISERSGPPFLFGDILILVPSSRLRRTYAGAIIEIIERKFHARAFVQPHIQTAYQFFQRLFSFAGGPKLIDENSRLVLLEGIVKELISDNPFFGSFPDMLAPSLSAAVADMFEKLSFAGINSTQLATALKNADFSDRPQVKLLTEAFSRYEQILSEKKLVDPAGMLALVEDSFDPAWISSYRRVLIDNIHNISSREMRIIKKLASYVPCTFLINAPGHESIRNAGDDHPLRLVKEFVVGVGLPPGKENPGLSEDDRFLAEALFSDKSSKELAAASPRNFAKDIRRLSAVNMREEVSLIGRDVKEAIRAGVHPDAILVSFPSLDEYGALVEEIFQDFGIPYNRALGRQLSSSPVTAAVIALLDIVQQDYSGASMLRAASSPFLKFTEAPIAPALDRLMRLHRITYGKDKWIAALKTSQEQNNFLSESILELFSALEPFSTDKRLSLADWMNRLSALIDWAGIAAGSDQIRGPFNINLQAMHKLQQTVSSLFAAGRLFPEYSYTFDEWLFLLERTFMHTRFQVPSDDEGGVQILGIEESTGLAWSRIYLGGLIEGKFPQRWPQNIFVPEAALEPLGVQTLKKARVNAAYHFYRMLLSAPSVTLTFPEIEGDRPIVPSPFLEELRALDETHLLNRSAGKMQDVQFSLEIEDAQSVPELAKAVAMTENIDGLEAVLDADIAGMKGIRAALAAEKKPQEQQNMVFPQPKVFSVTELDDYIACPFDYYVRHVLKIEPQEEVTEDISSADRGSRIHKILRTFYEQWRNPITDKNRAEAKNLLISLAEHAFRNDADTFRNRREKKIFTSVMADRFLDAEVSLWKQGYRPVFLEHEINFFTLRLSDGNTVELRAKIDRVDSDAEGNFIIVDYKTGRYPQPKKNIEQEIFQLPIYAVMVQTVGANLSPPLKKPVGMAYYDLSGKIAAKARDVVLFDSDARNDHPCEKPLSSRKSGEDFRKILSLSMDKARTAAEGILRRNFTAAPSDESRCSFCANSLICRKKHE